MFKNKERLSILEAQIGSLQVENSKQKDKISRLEEEKQKIKEELENEHLENYEQHKKLMQIERLLNNPFGSYKNLLQFKNKVQQILKNELADGNHTNSNR